MNTTPTIHVTLQVRNIAADDYGRAAYLAREQLILSRETRSMLIGLGAYHIVEFRKVCRIAKEANGTYTVTVP